MIRVSLSRDQHPGLKSILDVSKVHRLEVVRTFGIRQWEGRGGDAEYLVKLYTVAFPPLVDSLKHLPWMLGRRPKDEKRMISSIMSLLITFFFWHFLPAGDLYN